MVFFNRGDCGCDGSTLSLQAGRAICPPTGARVTDDRYFTLVTAAAGQLIVVPKGSNSQCFLTGALAGFVYWANGEVRVLSEIDLTLTLLNPKVDGAYPVPADFKYLFAGTGDPTGWRHFAAPTAGRYLLASVNGAWTLQEAGQIPGIQDVGEIGATVTKGSLIMLVNIGEEDSPEYALRRLAVADKRVVVGFVDEDSGEQTFRTLLTSQYLEHPKAKFTELNFRTIGSLDADGNIISGGFDQALAYGGSAVTDGVRLIFSPTSNRLYKAPPHTIVVTNVPTNAGVATVPTSYGVMPGGHGVGSSGNFNYTTVRIDFNAGLTAGAASNTQSFGVFRDGTLLQEFDNDLGTYVNLTYIDQSCPPGPHTYDIRWKRTSGSTTVGIRNSYLTVSTIQQ